MKKIFASTSILSLIVFAVACSPKKATSPSETPALLTKESAQKQYSKAQFAEGEVLFTSKCGTCHGLHKPEQFGSEKWNRVLNRMIPKAKATVEEGVLIRAFVIANSKSEA